MNAVDSVELESELDFSGTLDRLIEAIGSAGMTVFARIDHAEGARTVGLEMPPTVVLIYGNPRGGTPAMLAAPGAALDLPLRILVREEVDRVLISFHPAGRTLTAMGVPPAIAERLEAAQRLVAEAARR